MKVIVIGAGAIGKERIKALEKLGENITAVIDLNETVDHNTVIELIESDWTFICTPHDVSVEYVDQVKTYFHKSKILVEKPYLGEHTNLNVGLNYRFYKGVRQLLTDVQNKLFGDLISVNMILALGDAPGTEKTWRLDPLRAGKGAMLDPGIHLIDLAMLISEGSLKYISDYSNWKFWRTGFIEETHLIATDKDNCIYNIQASKCRWRNTFRIEVNGTEGYGIVEGRNRNYGDQTYRRGKRWGWQLGRSQKESEELVVNYDGEDSFFEETKAVLYGCEGIQPATAEDNKRCLNFIT